MKTYVVEKMEEKFSKGYRRVPGDVCKAEKAVDDVVKFIDEHVKCTPSKDNIFGVFYFIINNLVRSFNPLQWGQLWSSLTHRFHPKTFGYPYSWHEHTG